jgi:hypothetical protein
MKRAWYLIAVAWMGCDSGSVGDSFGTRIERRIATARCAATSGPECFSNSGPGVAADGFCEQLHVSEFRQRADAIDRGTVRVDEGEFDDCLRDVPCLAPSVAAPAWAPRDPLATCREAFVGTVAIGADCFVDEECAPQGFCAGASQTVCGACEARRATGARCERDAQCPPGLLCVNSTCVAATQVEDSGVGGPCGLFEQTLMSSATYASCRRGLYCVGFGMDRTCIDPLPVGASCTVGMGECASGAMCVSGVCVAQVIVQDVGAPCGNEVLCEPERLVCASGACAQRPGEGASCVVAPCRVELECVSGVCRRGLADGATCSRDSACASGFCFGSVCAREPVCAE